MRKIRVTIDYGWAGCEDDLEFEVPDHTSADEIEKWAWEAAINAADERISVEWEEIESE